MRKSNARYALSHIRIVPLTYAGLLLLLLLLVIAMSITSTVAITMTITDTNNTTIIIPSTSTTIQLFQLSSFPTISKD